MSQSENGDASETMIDCDCGHTVPKSERVSVPEVTLCIRCYSPAGVTDWPKILAKSSSWVREGRSASKHTSVERILGLDRRGRGVYWDERNKRVTTYVPKHDTAYTDDREQARERRDTERLRSVKKTVSGPQGAPHRPGHYVTMPNGDHLVRVETSEKLTGFSSLEEYLIDHTDSWQQVHPDIVQRHNLGLFSPESGKPLITRGCQECGHVEEGVDPDTTGLDCPECDSRKFYAQPPEV